MNRLAIMGALKALRLHWMVSIYRWLRGVFYRIVSTYRFRCHMRQNLVLKVHMGSGRHTIDGWLNMDIAPNSGAVYVDATKPLPFADNAVALVFGEHFIEHLSYQDGKAFLKECSRILRPGGRLRLSTPDLGRIMGVYGGEGLADLNSEEVFSKSHESWYGEADEGYGRCKWLNQLFRGWDHRFLYDEEQLTRAMLSVGFGSVERCAYRQSDEVSLHGLETHVEFEEWDNEMNLICEGGKC